MKIISWNINSLKTILEREFEYNIRKLKADIVCVQEIKISEDIGNLGLDEYYQYFNYSKIKGYAGVAIFSRQKPKNVMIGLPLENENGKIEDFDEESRVITLEFNNFFIVNVYAPCRTGTLKRFNHQMNFHDILKEHIRKLNKIKNVILCGDFNVCHKNIDICKLTTKRKLDVFSDEERFNFSELLNLGFIDTFRYMHPQMKRFTFWTNNVKDRLNNSVGWRLDYILVSDFLKKDIREANVLREIKGSDHCPVELIFKNDTYLVDNYKKALRFNGEKVMFLGRGYIRANNLQDYMYVKDNDDNEILEEIWKNYDFEKAEKQVYKWQCDLTRATLKNRDEEIRKLQKKIVYSTQARMLSVRKVSEISKSKAGVDKIVWRKDSEKMKAAILLNNGEYKAKPLKQFVFCDNKANKKRQVGIPTTYDRAMQVLYSYGIEPIAEAKADRKSFAFRKGRSPAQAHICLINCLSKKNAPEWILVSDIKSYYDTVSHEWLLENIPMDRYILEEFLKAGIVLNGELFKKDEGISLGSNLSTLLGNMTLDGIQKRLYDLQGDKITDFYNGFCVRFADDICIAARTKEDAEIFKVELEKFAKERGLSISKEKTKIVNIKDGFDFLARTYYKVDGIIECKPSEKSVIKFEQEIKDLIEEHKDKWSQRKFIQSINSKITGYATYHKYEDATDTFLHLDSIINLLLYKMMRELYSHLSKGEIIKRYWKKKDYQGKKHFSLQKNSEQFVKNMADTILVQEKQIDLKKNVFLDRDYFEELEKSKDIRNCVGKYKKIWIDKRGSVIYVIIQ